MSNVKLDEDEEHCVDAETVSWTVPKVKDADGML